jgi:hypothetical protein
VADHPCNIKVKLDISLLNKKWALLYDFGNYIKQSTNKQTHIFRVAWKNHSLCYYMFSNTSFLGMCVMPVAVGWYFIKEFILFFYPLLSTSLSILQRQVQTHKHNNSRRILTITDVPKTIKRQAIHLKRTNEVHSCNHCYRGKAIIIKYSECVFLALGIQHAKRMPVHFYSIFSHYLINGTIF